MSSAARRDYLLAAGLAALAGGVFVLGWRWDWDWRPFAGLGGLALAFLLLRFPLFGLYLTVATVFVGTPSLKITYATGAVTQFFPAMVLLPLVLLGFLAQRAAAGPPPPVARPSLTVLAPFVAVIFVLHVLGLAWAPHTRFALGHVATLAFDVTLFAAITAVVTDQRRLAGLLWTMMASAVAVCGFMLCGALYDWAGTIHLGRGTELNFELFSEERWGRIGGLCSANQAGGFLVLSLFLAVGLAMRYRRFARVGLCLLALAFLTFVVVSGSRGAILGFLGASGAFMLLHSAIRRRILSRSVLLAVLLGVAILVGKPSFIDRMLVGFGYSGPLLFSEKKTSDSAANVSGSVARFRMWRDALNVMADEPGLFILGLGPGGFIWHTREPEVHSLWLAFFFDLGLVGGMTGILGLAVLATSVAAAVKRAPPSPARTLFLAVAVGCLAEIGIHSLIDHDLTSPVSRFTWLYLSILAAALKIVQESMSECAIPMEAAHDHPLASASRGALPAALLPDPAPDRSGPALSPGPG